MRNKGVILIAVLWIIMLLSTIMYTLLSKSRIDYSISTTYAEEERLKHLALSAADIALSQILQGRETAVLDTIQTVSTSESCILTLKINDESAKLNINRRCAPLYKTKIISGTDLAAIYDFMDKDEKSLKEGAESSYYLSLEPPYMAKNMPFETIEELLYVKGIEYFKLFGKDKNQNGRIDNRELQDSAYDPTKDHGIYELATTWSYDLNEAKDGTPRLNINKADRGNIYKKLVDYLTPSEIHTLLAGIFRPHHRKTTIWNYSWLFYSMRESDQKRLDIIKKIVDIITFTNDKKLYGLININTARREILELLGLGEKTIEIILDYREKAIESGNDLSTIGWVIEALGYKSLSLLDYLTTRSSVFSIQVVARSTGAPVLKRYKIIFEVDRKRHQGRVIYLKDLSGLGSF